jgi:hypothetical protein
MFAVAILAVAALASAAPPGRDQRLPLKDGQRIVAIANGEAITFGQLLLQLDEPEAASRLIEGRATRADLELLDRLIVVRLVVQEATTMGIAELPEIHKQVDVASRAILRDVLMGSLVKKVVPDDAAVDAAFKDLAREWKTTSLLFNDEEVATRVRGELANGADFDTVRGRVVAENQAKEEADDAYHGRKEYMPEIAGEIAKLQLGDVTPAIRIPAGFIVAKVVDIRYVDTPEARAEARRIAASIKQQSLLNAEEQKLRDKYVVVHQDVVDSIDYEGAEPGIDALLKDTRIVADIKGAPPLTVGNLTDYLKLQFFHGDDTAGQTKRMNARKQAGFEATLMRRVMNLEAARRGIDRSNEYRDKVKALEDSLVFDTFVQKVIAPDNKMREQEVRTYYDDHLTAYSYPAMARLRTLGFTRRGSAEDAVEKLRKGTDFNWLAANADDQVAQDAQALAIPNGQLLMIDSLPDAVQKALANPKSGDVRLFADAGGQFYAIVVQDLVPPSARPYDEVRADIAKKLYGEKLKKGIEDYAAKLRAAGKVSIYLGKAN